VVKDKLGAAAASAPKGDPTGKYTLNGWGQTEADFAFFDLAQDKVELKSDGWRTAKIAAHGCQVHFCLFLPDRAG
jgi:hypothetical protein